MRDDLELLINRFQLQNVLRMSEVQKIRALTDALRTLAQEVEIEAGWDTAEAADDGSPLYHALGAANLLLAGLSGPEPGDHYDPRNT